MLKKLIVGSLVLACVAGTWNWTRVMAASEKVRDAWIESQQSQTLEDWDVHYRKGVRSLHRQTAKLKHRARKEQLAAETAKIRIERISSQIAASKTVMDAFAVKMKSDAGFVFAGQTYDVGLAKLQVRRFVMEHKALVTEKQALSAKVSFHQQAAKRYATASERLSLRTRKLEMRAQELMLRRRVLATQKILGDIEKQRENLRKQGCKPLENLEGLCRTAEEALDREEARQRIQQEKRPARTLSLEEAAKEQAPIEQAEDSSIY